MNNDDFALNRQKGKDAEELVATWLMIRGFLILPVYDYSGIQDNKAPKFQAIQTKLSLVTPDLLCAKDGALKWVEVKWKTSTTLYRKKREVRTGLPRKHWEHYKKVQAVSGVPVWLLFVQEAENQIVGGHIDKLEPIYQEHNTVDYKDTVYFVYNKLRLVTTLEKARDEVDEAMRQNDEVSSVRPAPTRGSR